MTWQRPFALGGYGLVSRGREDLDRFVYYFSDISLVWPLPFNNIIYLPRMHPFLITLQNRLGSFHFHSWGHVTKQTHLKQLSHDYMLLEQH